MIDIPIELSDSTRLVSNPLVSIMMLTYNHEQYLAEAIEGVVRQKTGFPIELLIGEDCSKDRTRAIALSYQERFPEIIRIITSENNIGADRNHDRLLAAARGEFLAYCEGDDFWHRNDKLSKQVALLEANPSLSFVASNYRVVAANGAILNEMAPVKPTCAEGALSYEDIQRQDIVATLTVCTRRLLVQTALSELSFSKCRGFLMGDLGLWLQLSQHGKFVYDPEPLASYRHSHNSAMRKADLLHKRRFGLDAYEVRYRFLKKYPMKTGTGETKSLQVQAVRSMLVNAAFLGAAEIAERQIQRLESLGARRCFGDSMLSFIASLPISIRHRREVVRVLEKFLVWTKRARGQTNR